MNATLWRWYVAARWWWYRTTGCDCSAWLRELIAHAMKDGTNTVIIPQGVYRASDPKLPTFATFKGPEIRGET